MLDRRKPDRSGSGYRVPQASCLQVSSFFPTVQRSFCYWARLLLSSFPLFSIFFLFLLPSTSQLRQLAILELSAIYHWEESLLRLMRASYRGSDFWRDAFAGWPWQQLSAKLALLIFL